MTLPSEEGLTAKPGMFQKDFGKAPHEIRKERPTLKLGRIIPDPGTSPSNNNRKHILATRINTEIGFPFRTITRMALLIKRARVEFLENNRKERPSKIKETSKVQINVRIIGVNIEI